MDTKLSSYFNKTADDTKRKIYINLLLILPKGTNVKNFWKKAT